VSNSALDHYMRARALVAERSPEQIQTGIGLFHQAVSEDPNFALAYASLADAYIAFCTYAFTQWPELVSRPGPPRKRRFGWIRVSRNPTWP